MHTSSCARRTVRPNQNIGVWSRERFIAGPSKENQWFVLKKPKFFNGFRGGVFIGKIWSKACRTCDFLLIGWW